MRCVGVSFFNPGDVLDGPDGSYTADRVIAGHQIPERLDGAHLNMAGSISLANYIADYVSRILTQPSSGPVSNRLAVQRQEALGDPA